MTRFTLISALWVALILPLCAIAEEAAETTVAAETEVGWDQFDDPSFEPDVEATTEASDAGPRVASEPSDDEILGSVAQPAADVTDAAKRVALDPAGAAGPRTSAGIVLGPQGTDDEGRTGRLHTVSKGNTLWDLANAYLGTPWVWPSVWTDNDDIDNPHLILPGDKIWITANEMRVVTEEEAEAFIAQTPAAAQDDSVFEMQDEEVVFEDDEYDDAPVAAFDDDGSDLDAFPVAVTGSTDDGQIRGQRVTVSRREAMGFVSAKDMAGAATIVGSPIERVYMAEGDDAVIGLGEGDVEIGDQFTIFTVIEDVRDPETRQLLGHHVEPLGWLEVRELTGETSIAQIRTSYSEIGRGTQIVRRNPAPRTVEVRTSPDAVEGKVVFLPLGRTLMADGGYVYINRGEFHGVEIGTELDVFNTGAIVSDRARGKNVRTPDEVVARLVVVTIQSDSAVAFVLWSDRELEVGDTVRPRIPQLALR